MITLFGAKTPESSKISQTVVGFSYLVSLNTFLFYPPTNFTSFWKIFLTKKSMKLERLLCKDKSSQNFINATRDVKVAMLQVIAIGYHSPPPYDFIAATKIRRERRKKADVWTIKCMLSCISQESIHLSVRVCSASYDDIPNGECQFALGCF